MSVQISINGDNAAEAVKELASLAAHFMHVPVSTASISADPVGASMETQQRTQESHQQNVVPFSPPSYQPEQPQQAVPVAPPVQGTSQATPVPLSPPGAVPTASPTYSVDQLAVAATQLVDAGRQAEVVQMLQQFGGPPLTAVPKEHYGAIATQLRAMGAKI
ncbi:hypothetical protein ACEF06_23695 [Brevibacillus agri]